MTEMPVDVLVVDDEPYVRDLVTRWLTAEGHRCAQAVDPRSAWQFLQAHEVALVTLDVRMAGDTGLGLLEKVHQRYPDTAVIMMTAIEDTQTAIQALTHGASAYLLKPAKREEFLFHAHKALERRQLLCERREYTQRLEQRVGEQTMALRRAQEETIHRLVSASLWRDEETGMHIRRTGLLSEVVAKAAGWSSADAERIRMAAPMHDVGKIGIPDAILRKPGRLTREEFTIMKTHTQIGAQMLSGSQVPMLQMAQEIALNHHERWDGAGYPNGLAGQAIPESARVVAIVDVYDALSHDRVYRPALPEDRVLESLKQGAGTHFDPLLLALFFANLPEISRLSQENPDEPADADPTEARLAAVAPEPGAASVLALTP